MSHLLQYSYYIILMLSHLIKTERKDVSIIRHNGFLRLEFNILKVRNLKLKISNRICSGYNELRNNLAQNFVAGN